MAFKFPQVDQQLALRYFLNDYLLPLHNSNALKKLEPVPIKRGVYKPPFEFDEMVHLLLRDSIGKVIYDIYKLYFAAELKGATDMATVGKESQKALFQFLKEFDICPGLITKAAAFNLFVDDANAVPLYMQTGI